MKILTLVLSFTALFSSHLTVALAQVADEVKKVEPRNEVAIRCEHVPVSDREPTEAEMYEAKITCGQQAYYQTASVKCLGTLRFQPTYETGKDYSLIFQGRISGGNCLAPVITDKTVSCPKVSEKLTKIGAPATSIEGAFVKFYPKGSEQKPENEIDSVCVD